jgi:hypothetical protein
MAEIAAPIDMTDTKKMRENLQMMKDMFKKTLSDLAAKGQTISSADQKAINAKFITMEKQIEAIESMQRIVQLYADELQNDISKGPPGGPPLAGGYKKSATMIPQAGGQQQYFTLENYLSKITNV